jgi:hypothetical protein
MIAILKRLSYLILKGAKSSILTRDFFPDFLPQKKHKVGFISYGMPKGP